MTGIPGPVNDGTADFGSVLRPASGMHRPGCINFVRAGGGNPVCLLSVSAAAVASCAIGDSGKKDAGIKPNIQKNCGQKKTPWRSLEVKNIREAAPGGLTYYLNGGNGGFALGDWEAAAKQIPASRVCGILPVSRGRRHRRRENRREPRRDDRCCSPEAAWSGWRAYLRRRG